MDRPIVSNKWPKNHSSSKRNKYFFKNFDLDKTTKMNKKNCFVRGPFM